MALSRLMPDYGGPTFAVRHFYHTVVHSVGMYAAPLWEMAAKVAKYQMMLIEAQSCNYKEVDYWLMQDWTGLFEANRIKVGKANSPLCEKCPGEVVDNVEHMVLGCEMRERTFKNGGLRDS
ncbi:hypothetical protein HHI36_021867 [Cryptolaemus montrouzieri]|uniref:Reverse transcriptase zinc-binding domain-containing protein n=1 Tax=Cryptolaemus montrouzieri TaxID=559131 RepID=A0ABD2MY16_9CUCU